MTVTRILPDNAKLSNEIDALVIDTFLTSRRINSPIRQPHGPDMPLTRSFPKRVTFRIPDELHHRMK